MRLLADFRIIYNAKPQVWNNQQQKYLDVPIFSGKVTSITRTSEAYEVRLTPITDLSDIFDQLIGVEVSPGFAHGVTLSTYNAPYYDDEEVPAPQKAKGSFNYDLAFNCNVGLDSITAGGNWKVNASATMEGKLALKVVYEITSSRKYVNVEVKPTFRFGGSLGAKREPDGNGDLIKPNWIQPGITVPFPSFLPIFRFSTSFYPFLKAEGSMEFNAGFKTPEIGFRICFGYNDGKFPGSFNLCLGDSPTPEANARFSFNGSLMAGLGAEFKLGTVDWLGLFDAKAELRVGPKLSVDAGIDLLNINNTGSTVTSNLYDALKDSKVGLSLTSEFDLKGKLATSSHEYTFATLSRDYFSKDWYLMPEFSDLTVEQTLPARYSISYKPSRNVLLSPELGYAICHEDGRVLTYRFGQANDTHYYSSAYYRGEKAWENEHPDKLYHSNDPNLPIEEQTFYIPERPGPFYVAPCLDLLGMKLYSRDWTKVNFAGCPDHNHPHMVDLGTGVKWPCSGYVTANWGVGQWGGSPNGEYCYNQDPPVISIAGTKWDSATCKWGAPWQTPTIGDVDALMAGTEPIFYWNKNKDENVILVSKEEDNNNYIFLPLRQTFLTSTVHRAAYTIDSTTDIWSFGHHNWIWETLGGNVIHAGLNHWKNCDCNDVQYEKYNLKITTAAGIVFPCAR